MLGRQRQRWFSVAVPLVLVLVLLAVWRAGGFEPRRDTVTPVAPGTTVTAGPYEFTFTHATVQRGTGLSDEVEWQLNAVGRGRTTGDVSIRPPTLDPMFLSQDPASRQIVVPDSYRHGADETITEGSYFTPGLPSRIFRVVFRLPSDYTPGPTVSFVVSDLVFSDQTLLRTGEKSWNTTEAGFRYELPVRRLPDEP